MFAVNPQYSVSGVTVTIYISSLNAEKIGENTTKEELFFDMNAKLEEQKRENSQVTLIFNLQISTKPSIVKYNTTGTVILAGKSEDIKKKLEANPKTQIPQILFTIYQHVFSSIFMLSSNLNTPYPPPDLLHPMAEKIQIVISNKLNENSSQNTENSTEIPLSTTTQTQDKKST